MAPPGIQDLQFPCLNIPVTIEDVYSVLPAGPIPAADGDRLYLSNLDDMIAVRVLTPTVYFYRRNESNSVRGSLVGEVLRDALADVLIPYYPFSGRLRETHDGKLELFFGPNQGALMIEARANIALADLGDLVVPNPAWSPLIYRLRGEGHYEVVGMPLVIAQVTKFSCGGFSLGLRLCHCLCDGIGAMQFVGAWAMSARLGSNAMGSSPPPCWDREFFCPRDPPAVTFPHVEFVKVDDESSLGSTLSQAKLVQKCYRVSQTFQAQLKQQAQWSREEACTSFDAMAAHVWRSWAESIQIQPPDYKLRLSFSVNVRPKLRNPPLKEGFYGNAFCVACAASSAARLLEGSLSDAARLIRDARVGVSEEYVRSTVDYMELNRPRRLEFAGKLTITQWTRFLIYESSDFGWGRALYAGPIELSSTPQVCVFLPDGERGGSGSMAVWICLPEYATRKFMECLLKIN